MKNVSKHEIYNDKFLFDTLFLLKTQIEDLKMWSVYNQDMLSDEIQELKEQSEQLRKTFIALDKSGNLPTK